MKQRKRLRLVAAGLLVAAAMSFAPATIPLGTRTAEAFHGMARRHCRRVVRRTTRRVVRRHLWAMPVGYTTVLVGGVTYYVSDGVRYRVVIIDGRTAYEPV